MPDPTDDPALAIASRMATAAAAWLGTLDEGRQRVARRAAPMSRASDEEDRRAWHYTPVDHGGLTLGAMDPEQQSLAMQLVASGLSAAGYVTVCTVMGLENVLDAREGFSPVHDGLRLRDPGRYYLRVFGDPGGPDPWGWRLGGHHVSLNNLVVDGRVAAVTPNFLGANPAASPLLGGGVLRPLGATEDLARELVRSLPPRARQRAVVADRAPADIVSGERPLLPPGADIGPMGLPAGELDGDAHELLRRLVDAYTGRVPAGLVPPVDLDRVHVAWAGSLEPGEPHYHRLSGPGLLVEWDDTQNGANHAHSVWRDPRGDFGADVLAEHRAAHHTS